MQAVEGILLIAQESRFQVIDGAGLAHTFVLGHSAAAEPAQSLDLQRDQARVRVCCAEATDVIGAVATRIERI